MINNETCMSIAFYNLDASKTDILQIFNFAEDWMRSFGYEPKRGGIHSADYTSSKTKSFKFVKNKLLSCGAKNIRSIFFYSYNKEWDVDMIDGILSFRIDQNGGGEFCIYYCEKYVNYTPSDLNNFIKNILKFIYPEYGFVFHREKKKGPDFYVMGVALNLDEANSKEEIESIKISNWRRAYQTNNGTYKTGMLRDIYPMNFISKIHLDQPVYGGSLQQWIESSSLHGELEKFNENLWLWTVPEDKTESIANDLKDTGLIVSLRD